MMMRLFSATVLGALMIASGYAQTVRVDRVVVVEKGIFRIQVTGAASDANSPTDQLRWVPVATLVKDTTTIQAQQGLAFGFRFLVEGTPKGTPISLRVVERFPPGGIRNPETGETFHVYETSVSLKIGERSYAGYGFEHSWEEVPGIWTFELWYQDRKLVEQSFDVANRPP
jgi:hypothetical protein